MVSESLIFEAELFAESESAEGDSQIRNVLLCGNKSLNGYEIPESAFGSPERVTKIYNDAHVYLNHNIEHPLNRQVQDLAGVIRNARLVGGRPRGDIQVAPTSAGEALRKLHAFSKRADVRNLGLSHVAEYVFETDRKRVKSVEKVFSVDVVARPATTKSSSESQKTMEEVESLKREREQLQQEIARLKAQIEGLKKPEEFNPTKALESFWKWSQS